MLEFSLEALVPFKEKIVEDTLLYDTNTKEAFYHTVSDEWTYQCTNTASI